MVFYKARCLGLLSGLVFLLPFQPVFAQATSPPVDLWDDLELLYQRAELAAEAKDHQQAVDIYQQIIQRDRDNPLWPVYSDLGDSLLSLGRFEEAAAAYRKAIELAPNEPQLYRDLAWCLNVHTVQSVPAEQPSIRYPNSPLLQEAEQILSKAIELDPQNAKNHYLLGQISWKLGDYQKSKASFEKGIELDPEYKAFAYTQIASLYNYQGKPHNEAETYAKAETYAELAIAADPEYSPAYLQLGQALRGQGKLPDALRRFQEGLELARQNPGGVVPPASFEYFICRLQQPAGTQC